MKFIGGWYNMRVQTVVSRLWSARLVSSYAKVVTSAGAILASIFAASINAASAQQFVSFGTVNPDDDQIQIVANDTVTFNTELGTFAATGDVQVLFGDIVVFGDRVEAVFEDGDSRQVKDFASIGDIYFATGELEGQADRLDADLSSGQYVFTGADIQIITDAGRILSDQIVVLNQTTGRVDVKSTPSNSFLVGDAQTVASDIIEIEFKIADDGSLGALDVLRAIGNAKGEFDGVQLSADTLISGSVEYEIELIGNVSVRQGTTVLGGNCMTYNTETGSTALSNCPEGVGSNTNGKVTGRLRLTD